MSYFLTTQNLHVGEMVEIAGEEARHILLSRRMRNGERFELQGADGKRFSVELSGISKKFLRAKVISELEVPKELSKRLVVFQAVVAEKVLDLILQKAVELGISEIVLFNTANVATKLTAAQFEKKSDRWNKILWEAAKQCGRGGVPALRFQQGLEGVLTMAQAFPLVYVCDAGGRLEKFSGTAKSVGAFVGPEGGFTDSERKLLGELKNQVLVKLSEFTLRSETAAIAVMALMTNTIP